MRVLVFLLVAGNLVFFAWTQGYLGARDNPDAVRLAQQLGADKLKVLSRDEPPVSRHEPPVSREEPPVPKAPPVEKALVVADKCVAWAGLAEAEAAQVDALLADKYAGLRRTRHVVPEHGSWWVLIPPLASKADADRKAGELKRFGVPEFFIIQDAGPNRFAISLGIFSSESAANERLEVLKGKGVKSAKIARRNEPKPAQVSLEANGPEPMVDAAVEALARQLPAAKVSACGKS